MYGVMVLHTAHLDNLNLDFAYIDSGPPSQCDDYTTLVCIHGNTYHAQAFQRLFPLASAYNVRFIALNRRDYLGSTPFTPTELAELFSTDATHHRKFLFDRGLEIAYFLLWVITQLKIPPTRTDHDHARENSRGGLALLGWSLGNITSLAFLSNLSRYPCQVIEDLEPYLRHYFIYEVVYQFLGIPSPEGAYHPLWDEVIPLDQKAQAIDAWFTSYFSHPHFPPPVPSSSTSPSPSLFPSPRCLSLHAPEPERTLSSLTLRTPHSPPPGKKPTSANRTAKEYEAITDHAPVMRSEIAFYGTIGEETLFAQYRDALSSASPLSGSVLVEDGNESRSSNANAASASTIANGTPQNGLLSPLLSPFPLPSLRITVLDATHTVWNIIYATWCISSDLERWSSCARAVRHVNFRTIEGANHYAVWDDPETLTKTLVECL